MRMLQAIRRQKIERDWSQMDPVVWVGFPMVHVGLLLTLVFVFGTLVAADRQRQLDESVRAAVLAKAGWAQDRAHQDAQWLQAYKARLAEEKERPPDFTATNHPGYEVDGMAVNLEHELQVVTNIAWPIMTNVWEPARRVQVWGDSITDVYVASHGGAWLRLENGRWTLIQSNSVEGAGQ